MTKRKNHFADFKARVALEGIREELTLSELAKKYGVHAGPISTWKRTALDNMPSAFERRSRAPDTPSPAAIEKQFLETPWYGSRQMARHMERQGHKCGRHRVRRLMRLMRLVPIYQELNTSKKHPQHKIWPYLLRKMVIDQPNQVWCADITYIPLSADCFAIACRQWMQRGFLYLVAIMDWYSRKVLAWRLSAEFCVEALQEALATHGTPEIFNTDQAASSPAPFGFRC